MTTNHDVRSRRPPERRPAKELPAWARRLRRVLLYIDTLGASEWLKPVEKKHS